MDQAYTLNVFAHDNSDITGIISEICDNTRTNPDYDEKPHLEKIQKLVISKDGNNKIYKLSNPPFFIYGGLGIVFGLNDFDDTGISGIQYVLKVDCPQRKEGLYGLTMKTAISINEAFQTYPNAYDSNLAQEYGNLHGMTKFTFAIYKYLGIELGNIIYKTVPEKRETHQNERLVKLILRNVISCLRRFNEHYFNHGDFCTENLVINLQNYHVDLIDFDTMRHFAHLLEAERCSLKYVQDTTTGKQFYTLCPPHSSSIAQKCVNYEEQMARSLFPTFSQLLGLSRDDIQTLLSGYAINLDTTNTVNKIMMADRYGLFWVIIKILLTASGYHEDEIEMSFKIDYRQPTTYVKFYKDIKINSQARNFYIRHIKTYTPYIKSELFEKFIGVVFELITNTSLGNTQVFDKLLQDPFLTESEQIQTSEVPLPVLEQTQELALAQNGQSAPETTIPEQSHEPAAAVPISAKGGYYNKKRRPSRSTRHTKKQKSRNKQTHRNRSKKVKSKQSRK